MRKKNMSSFIEQLESRELFSVNGTTISAHQAAILTAATAARSDLSLIFSTSKVDDSVVFVELSAIAKKSNTPLIARLESDLNKAADFLTKDLGGLLGPALAVTSKTAGDAARLLSAFSTKLDSTLIADEKALVKSVSVPAAKFNAILGGTSVTNDLNALLDANSGDVKLRAAIDERLSAVARAKVTLGAAVGTLASQVLSFESDLKTVTGG